MTHAVSRGLQWLLFVMAVKMTRWCVNAQKIEFTCHPSDVTATEGQSTMFCCQYAGTIALPVWRINGTLYSLTNLPPYHYYWQKNLHLDTTERWMNSTPYSCVLLDESNSGGYRAIESCTAILLIGQPQKNLTFTSLQQPFHDCCNRNCTTSKITEYRHDRTFELPAKHGIDVRHWVYYAIAIIIVLYVIGRCRCI